MYKKSLVTLSLLASFAAAGTAYAADAGSCADVKWKTEVLAKYPDIANSCVGVVDRDGKKYVRLSGKVASKGKDSITVLLDNTRSTMTWKPTLSETVSIEGDEVPAMSVAIDQKLRFYMPQDQVAM